jgi:hypothetical protein
MLDFLFRKLLPFAHPEMAGSRFLSECCFAADFCNRWQLTPVRGSCRCPAQ